MIARMSRRVIEGIYARSDRINTALALIPPTATLVAPEDDVPWSGLGALMGAVHGAPEVGLPRATKVLHKKRPALIPILDSVVEAYLRGVEGFERSGDFARDAVTLTRGYKRELEAGLPALRALQAALRSHGIDLTEVRLLDLFLWGYSGTYTPLYLREGEIPARSTSATPRTPLLSTDGHDVALFRDDESGYLTWLAAHPHGFVLNTNRSPRPDYLVLHRASCRTISGRPPRGGPWTGQYIKLCADDSREIVAWAEATIGATPRECGACRR
jgi:hypothetical protein